jgi:hypothetical protein
MFLSFASLSAEVQLTARSGEMTRRVAQPYLLQQFKLAGEYGKGG